MGKSLKGRECGKGIYQRKDGKYHARFDDRFGKSHGKYFKTLPEARNWLEEAKYRDKHSSTFIPTGDLTVDEWFNFWLENLVSDLSPNGRRANQVFGDRCSVTQLLSVRSYPGDRTSDG